MNRRSFLRMLGLAPAAAGAAVAAGSVSTAEAGSNVGARGVDEARVRELEQQMAKDRQYLPRLIVDTMREARSRRVFSMPGDEPKRGAL